MLHVDMLPHHGEVHSIQSYIISLIDREKKTIVNTIFKCKHKVDWQMFAHLSHQWYADWIFNEKLPPVIDISMHLRVIPCALIVQG